nr:hypothetical protein [Actinomycetota bacterium]
MRVTLLRAYLCVGLILIGVYPLVGGSERIYESLGLAAAAAIVYGTLTHRPPARAGWLTLAASQAALGVGDLVYFNAYGDSPPYPSLADAFYLGGIVLFGVALIMIVGRSEYGRDLLSYVDAVVIAFALGLLVWAGFFSGAIGSGANLARVVSVSYPLLEVVLLAALLRAFFVRGKRTRSYYALAASVCLLILSDTWYVVPALTGHYVAGSWHDLGWLGSYVLAGAAGLHPSMRIFVVPRAGVLHIRRVILLGLSVVGIAVAAMVEQAVVGEVDIFVMAGAAAVAGLFVVARVVGLIRVLERATAAALESERRFRMVFERAPIGISMGRQ